MLVTRIFFDVGFQLFFGSCFFTQRKVNHRERKHRFVIAQRHGLPKMRYSQVRASRTGEKITKVQTELWILWITFHQTLIALVGFFGIAFYVQIVSDGVESRGPEEHCGINVGCRRKYIEEVCHFLCIRASAPFVIVV